MTPEKMLPKSRSASVTRPDQLLDEVDREHDPVRREHVVVVAAEALLADAGHVHPDDDQQRECVGQVDVRGRRRHVLRVVAGRDEGQPVRDQDEQEERDRERHHERRRAHTHRVLDLMLDLAR